MKFITAFSSLLLGWPALLAAHDLATGAEHGHYDFSVQPPGAAGAPAWFLAQADRPARERPQQTEPVIGSHPKPAAAFEKFAPAVRVRWDQQYLWIESNGLPAHSMMTGITAWQQQVPLPQAYVGANAWRLPLAPVPARVPLSIKNQFLRGAIALAANGIPIFNPQNNRGEISAEIGELDQWGGHCGRADDYHYHAAPLHLQSVLGPALPIAYALDGYPIYGLTEPDGSAPAGLDSFNGHETKALGYHYHASKQYPYINGGFHGEVVERDGQVDPQPRAQSIREALPALRGARITNFITAASGRRTLSYTLAGRTAAVEYEEAAAGTWRFEFVGADGDRRQETYSARARGSGAGAREPERRRAPQADRPPVPERAAPVSPTIGMDDLKKPVPGFVLTSPEVGADGRLPADFTGDGSGVTPPLAWQGAPTGTRSYALVMDHLAPGNEIKSYWVLWDLPASLRALPRGAHEPGKVGRSFRGEAGYEPPHSKGPGDKTYVLTLYALTEAPNLTSAPPDVTREMLLAAVRGKVLGSASLDVHYTRSGEPSPAADPRPASPPTPARPGSPGAKADPKSDPGLIKATMTDTMKAEIYADNWFALYINGRLTVVDPIAFLPHNVVSVDLLPEYPMTIAVIAHDNADPKTGLEYGNHIGDAGLVLKFADGTVTDGSWKVKAIERGPIGGEIAHPRVETEPRPNNWFAPDFDDSSWENAAVFTEQRVNPKPPYYEHDFSGAQFIWSKDLDLDNTVLFRKRIEKPGWTSRWTAQPAGPLPPP